ncbi:hypothetical protein V3C99_004725 [Haemonchus contortus]
MQLATARLQNNRSEEENMTAQVKKQTVSTPRLALGNVKNVATPNRAGLKPSTPMPKPTLQTVSSNLDISESRRRLSELCSGRSSLKPQSSALQPSEFHRFDLSDDVIEECSLEEDQDNYSPSLQDNAVLHEAENEAEYLQKLISRDHGGLYDIDEEDPIEFCGPENEPDNYDDIKTNAPVLTEDYHRFQYEKPDEDGLQTAKKYTLEEMETLFDSVNEVLIF